MFLPSPDERSTAIATALLIFPHAVILMHQSIISLDLSSIMLKNGQTYFKNLAVFKPQNV